MRTHAGATGSNITKHILQGVSCEAVSQTMAWWSMIGLAFFLLNDAVGGNVTANVTENVTELPRCDTLTSTDLCRDACTTVYGAPPTSLRYGFVDCLCRRRVDGELQLCCDDEFVCTTTTTTTKASVTCYSLPSMDDCIQACIDQYGGTNANRVSVLFKHREQCETGNRQPCCDIDGARALSLLPAAMISVTVFVAKFL
ncbi:unnamed protein product [Symbiodinium natans]|uniref:Uncharacterized protein n=1 Tax=Symbiodinium natans TaxID=878477 RepID=A0A812U5H9_9DINO|nr:unnamed protein product [Symbiodinium natans]